MSDIDDMPLDDEPIRGQRSPLSENTLFQNVVTSGVAYWNNLLH